ncbi:GNAT family N-acetyltransferase [Cyanobacteria bacterium FACHB-DQ100]|uniref:GNAT family N-acetyltransferase n=1 Tax=unclassified Leptolyngbya TaxID=2650499 RepID=UPI00168027B9|nr:GNAT family N-acetyltransferase [Leptolyngbya sp. FACHB-17]MBD1823951.1 GNAT family N-acetyltransferase [Cyanobacteria bacterium FACHB-DQ100]MBD2082831.1 GNAT family N-acetyltransferase [Leptolyngbya sp. FACHB-17]
MLQTPVLLTSRLIVRLLQQNDTAAIVKYYTENRAFLEPFEPLRPANFHSREFWSQQIEKSLIEFGYDRSLRLFLFKKDDPRTVIGAVNFTNMSQGVLYSCNLGYSLAEKEQGHGYMNEALQAAIQYVFTDLNLHRISANYMPHNRRSANVLKKLGFVIEGYARDYLLINGKWEDHIRSSLINENWRPS